MGKGLTLSIIFEAQSLNYGEGTGNISELKKVTRADGTQYTFASRQSIRYDIVRLGHERFGWNLDVVDKVGGGKATIQFKPDATIEDSPEMDLFGYMKTEKGQSSTTRSAVVRLSHAFSLEPYRSDLEFLSNKGFADRLDTDPNIANIEQHKSFYTYTVTVDLDKVGVDGEIELPNKVKVERIHQLLEIIKTLNRKIRGRMENLSPLFVIGGVYDFPNPYFLGRIKLNMYGKDVEIDIAPIRSTLELEDGIKENTYCGFVDGIFNNKDEFSELLGKDHVVSVGKFFKTLEEKVEKYYMEKE